MNNIKSADLKKIALTVSALMLINSSAAFAAPPIAEKFRPVIQTIQDIAEPVSYGMMIFGGIKYAMSDTSEGKKMILNAVKGFVGIQMMPWAFDIIKSLFR